jgi:hypothetical protein
VSCQAGVCLAYGLGWVLSGDEQDERRLGIPPDGVAEQLIDGHVELRRPVPELALADECVPVAVTNEDVCLAFAVLGPESVNLDEARSRVIY